MREMREQERLNQKKAKAAQEAVRKEMLRIRLASGQATVGETLREVYYPVDRGRPQAPADVGAEGAFNLEDIAQNPETWINRYPDIDPEHGLEVRGHDEL